jgi:hypothetical protein
MFAWTAAIMFGSGSVGPCGGSDVPELWMGIVVLVPSLVRGVALARLVGSMWMLAAPFIADVVMLGAASVIGLAQGRLMRETPWVSPWNPYVWVFVVISLGAWRVSKLRPHPPWACQMCGYDRRGLEAGVVCPECGRGAIVRAPGQGPPGRIPEA